MKLFSVFLISFFAVMGSKSFADDLPVGGVSFGFASVDAEQEHGHIHDIEQSGSGLSFYYFLDERLEVAFSRMTGDYEIDNWDGDGKLKYDIEKTVMGIFVHNSRTNILTGEGDGLSFGVRSVKEDYTNGEDDAYFYSDASYDYEELVFRTTWGLENGLSWGSSLSSDIDKFLDDYEATVHITKAIEDDFTVTFGYTFFHVKEDDERDDGNGRTLEMSIGYHF